jgi:predicted HAD superfamily Cof-like phosphohydrolase
VVHGFAIAMGWDLEEAFRRVHASNMPKLCSTEQEAEDTVTAYEKSREDGTSTYDSPAYRYHEALQKWVVYNQSTGKILKSILYHPVELGDLV